MAAISLVIRGVCTDSPRTSEELGLDILEHVRAEAALKWLLGVGHGNQRIRSPLALDVYAVSQDWGGAGLVIFASAS